ncbi:hypothetical protein GIB67_000895 [Kingdonia uniflora]|uniref:Ubiquitin-like protease family profile domain-containing protein n=1 Tax=Kingdonia uniflora TaxID=39325 RepID=A0A7J7M2P5_9MAGN|nr:hypothetical protein GIB67_000895 [Kingdonia uniflora]
MKSNKEVIEHVDEENQTQEGGAKKGTSNAKNYTSQCIGVGLNKMFVALPEEEKGALRTTCFTPLLLIDPIATMLTLVVKIFDRHLGDMKFQFWGTIIQMKPIHVCLILGLRVSPIANEFLFVDPKHMTNFRMRRFPKKKNTYGLKEIDDALKHTKLERHHVRDSILPLGDTPLLGQYQFSTLEKTVKRKGERGNEKEDGKRKKAEPRTWQRDLQQKNQNIEEKKKGKGKRQNKTNANKKNKKAEEADVPLKKKENLLQQVAHGEGLEVVKDLMVDDDVEVGREVNLKATSSEYGGDLLEWKKCKIDGEEKAEDDKEQPQVADEEKVQEASTDQTTVVYVEEQIMEVAKTEDEASQSVYLQASAEQTAAISVEEQTTEVAKTEDEASQVIDVYIKSLNQYFDAQHRARQDKEKIVLADVFACQYIGRDFNVRTCNMSSPESVEFKKKSIWEQITSMQWDCTVSNCIHQGDLKVPNGYDCGVYVLVFMDNILKGMKFLDLIDGDEYRYTIGYDILRLKVEP